MQIEVELGVSTDMNEPGFGILIKCSDLTPKDTASLIEYSQKPLTDPMGGTLIACSPLAAIELFVLYFCTDQEGTLKNVRNLFQLAGIEVANAHLVARQKEEQADAN